MKPHFCRPVLYISTLLEQASNVDNNHDVYPMTALDEITLRTPDALLNGLATRQVISNCLPDFEDKYELYACDIQHILISIRIATSGNIIEFEFKCPECASIDSYEINIQKNLPLLSAKKWFTHLEMPDFVLTFYPHSYRIQNDFALLKFKIDRQLFQLSKLPNPEEYTGIAIQLVETKTKLTLKYYSDAIQSITMKQNDIKVMNRTHINEWFQQADTSQQNQIIAFIDEAIKETYLPNFNLTCDSCKKNIEIPMDMDFSKQFRDNIMFLSEEEILESLEKMGKQITAIREDLMKSVWFMRGSISYGDSLFLTNNDRKIINKIVEDNMEASKKMGMPIF